MNSLTHTFRRTSLTAATTLALLAITGPAALASNGASADIDVAYGCTSIDVSSTKDISNVVLQFADGDRQKFDGLSGRTGTFAGTGELISTAWVKSGANFSNDGPGYGERFDFDADQCQTTADTFQEDEGDTEPSNDDERGNADEAKAKKDTKQADSDDKAASVEDDTSQDDAADDDNGDNDAADDDNGDNDAADDGSSQDDSDEDQSSDNAGTTDTSDSTDGGTTGSAGSDAMILDDDVNESADDSASRDAVTDETPAAEVLGNTEGRVRSADSSGIRFADVLPNTGADAGVALLAALSALAIGGGLLRRRRTS